MNVEKKVLELSGIPGFNPMQKAVLKKDWKNKSIVASAPTASGKTLLAELAAVNSVVEKKRKVIYTCPLRALAAEHWSEFKRKYSFELKIRVALSTGDLDGSSSYLQNYDIIFTTYEKLDSLLRHRSDWLSSVGLLVIDEAHSLGSDRGPTIEMGVTKLRALNPVLQVLALSATIPNAKELSEWLEAELIESDYRPIPLREGVFFDGEIEYANGKKESLELKEAIKALVKDTLFSKGKQALVFANTRKRAESIASQLAPFVEKHLDEKEKKILEKESKPVLTALEAPTEQCRKLSYLISKGVSFHHAGLLGKQRTIVEDLFKSNKIKLIAATPTLAAGVNMPSHTVIIPSLYRYTAAGMQRIPVSEYKQQVGRAGRPRYDTEGRGIVVARSESDKEDVLESFINGTVEPVDSKLGYEPILRTHMLALIASHFVHDLASMEEFFKKTFYAKQFSNMQALFEKLQNVLEQLEEMEFISKFSPLSYLFLVCNCSEMVPWVSTGKANEPGLWDQLQLRHLEIPVDLDREMFFDLNLLKKFNTCLMLEQWIEESREQTIMDDFKTQPGILHAKLNRADWLCYSTLEIAKLLKMQRHYTGLSKLRKRLKHGIKEELIMLSEVRYIGRVRARKLWRNKIRTVAELKKTDVKDLSRLLGEGTARKVKQALGQKA